MTPKLNGEAFQLLDDFDPDHLFSVGAAIIHDHSLTKTALDKEFDRDMQALWFALGHAKDAYLNLRQVLYGSVRPRLDKVFDNLVKEAMETDGTGTDT